MFRQAGIVCQLSAIVTGLRLGRVPWKGIIANGPFRNLIPLVAANQPSYHQRRNQDFPHSANMRPDFHGGVFQLSG
jgi:hypothetical protein